MAPNNFNAKINALKLNNRNPALSKLVDRYEVRKYVVEKIGSKYQNNILGHYENVEEINFELLPDSFVLKATHGSGWVLVCADKSKFDFVLEKRP